MSDIYHVLHTEEEDILSHRKQRGALYRRGVSSKQVDSHCPRVTLHVVPGKKETEKPYTNHFHISAVWCRSKKDTGPFDTRSKIYSL